MLNEIKKAVPSNIKKAVKNQIRRDQNNRVANRSNPNLVLTDIDIDIDNVYLTIKEGQDFKISRLGFLVSDEKKIYDLEFIQSGNQIIISQIELQKIDKIGKHVFRIFYENDIKAHTLQLVDQYIDLKYPVSSENAINNSKFLNFYSNLNKNLTVEVISKSKRKTAPKYIQGYLDGQFNEIQENFALFEANHGKTNSGNMFSLAIELASRNIFEVYWVSKNPESAEKMFEFYGIRNIKVIKHLSYEYGNIIATAKYLFTDNTFYPFFSKREGQILTNTWHGTPLKTLGKDIKGEETSFGNIVKTMLQVDHMYFSNQHTAERHLKSLDLDGILDTDVYIAPSPRNSSFFNSNHKKSIIDKENLQNKKVFVYLPTYRGKSSNANDESASKIQEILNDFVATLPENYIIYYKLHPIDTQDLTVSANENRVRKIPDEYELYDFLSVTDGLITDYSSIMFDYALSDKPIYLYTYDKEEYFSERGTYLDIDSLPFPKFFDSESLVKSIVNNSQNKINLKNFKNKFAPYDNGNGAKEIIDNVLYGINTEHFEKYDSYNGKPNVYIMGGSLWANGVTSALKNVIDNIDLNEKNYILLVDSNNFKQSDIGRYRFFDERIRVYPFKGFAMRSTFEDKLVKEYELGNQLTEAQQMLLNNAFQREIRRIFGKTTPDYFIHFSGYEVKFAEFVIFMENTKTMMYVHNDMFKEYATRKNFNRNVIFEAYNKSYRVVLVNEELKDNFVYHFPDVAQKTVVANNFIGYKNIKKLENDSLAGLLLDINFQYSVGSQGQGNPIFALKERLLKGIENKEERFSSINNIYNDIDGLVSGLERNRYLSITDDSVLKKIVTQEYFSKEYSDFHNKFGNSNDVDEFLVDLLLPKAVNKYRLDILPSTKRFEDSLYKALQEEKPEKINIKLSEFKNIYNNYGLRKLEVIEEINDPDIKIFVNIARFDVQKRLDRLILAFEKVYESDKETRLYIVASHGKDKDAILGLVRNSVASQAIRIFGAMDNPYPLLKRCDCFVFTSDYEALGLVVYEALAVGLPVVTTNLSTTMKNLNDRQVCPVELSVEGVYNGMQSFLDGNISNEPFDFVSYEKKSQKEFETIFEKY
ncbi:CDP-glycerol glycerophosphotransferase family protein [Weissella sagaensis]|uniref:CDP-glycerol glycerophosphotransferase family protein n=1 Tax=Weissella sagaensis TaxID=2559928 RepID=UPI00214C6185|nr:CDP-glycerol glycerophosphotransferase family protein [Weissella sagaensis]